MQPNDFQRFHAVMTGIAELHQRELSDFLLDAYWLALREWNLEDFESAAAHLMNTLKWMPKPSDFTELRKAGEPTAAEAWTIVLSGAPLPPGSRMARAANACGGQQSIRREDIETRLPFTQKRFIEAYDDLTKVDPVRDALPQIAEHGKRAALSAPTNIAVLLPSELTQRSSQPEPVALPAPAVAPTPAKVATPPKSAREKILKLLPLGYDDDAIAKVAGESVEVVREVRAELERAA